MNLGRVFVIGGLALIMGFGLYSLNQNKSYWLSEVEKLNEKVSVIQKENSSLQAKIDYYAVPENLLKEVKTQFNYREVGENLIIIVPASPELQQGEPASSSTASSTPSSD